MEDQSPTLLGPSADHWASYGETERSLSRHATRLQPQVNWRGSAKLEGSLRLRAFIFLALPRLASEGEERVWPCPPHHRFPAAAAARRMAATGRLERDGRVAQGQFGRGPTKAQSHLAGADALLCVLEDALLPAERAMVEMGEQQRVREARTFLQVATAGQFIATVEAITGRTVRAFACATDPTKGSSWRTSSSRRGPTRGPDTRLRAAAGRCRRLSPRRRRRAAADRRRGPAPRRSAG